MGLLSAEKVPEQRSSLSRTLLLGDKKFRRAASFLVAAAAHMVVSSPPLADATWAQRLVIL